MARRSSYARAWRRRCRASLVAVGASLATSTSRLKLTPLFDPQACIYHQFEVIGRRTPTETDPEPKAYRIKLFTKNETQVCAV